MKNLKKISQVKGIVHIVDGGENGYIHPDEINTDVKQDLFTEESLDIDAVNPDTGENIKICSNEPGNGFDQKGDLNALFPEYTSDNLEDIEKEIKEWKKNNQK